MREGMRWEVNTQVCHTVQIVWSELSSLKCPGPDCPSSIEDIRVVEMFDSLAIHPPTHWCSSLWSGSCSNPRCYCHFIE